MTGVLSWLALGILLGWVVFAVALLVTGAAAAVAVGTATAAVCLLLLRDTVALRGAMALLAPFGVMLPALALRHAAVKFGAPVPGFATWELALFLLAYMAFLATAFGVIPVDLYRLGYAPAPVALMVLAVCGYGAVTGNWFLPLVAVLGQAGWIMGWGSSNWFDHVTHVLLVPVAAVALLGRVPLSW
ncbi:MAG: hypothetical protein RI571_10240 [Roseovarius sp.]|nr:hypothetical protein [Roseovarius sp.]